MSRIFYLILTFSTFFSLGCNYAQDKKKKRNSETSPQIVAGYNLSKPEIFVLPPVLLEISGIAFDRNNNDTIYSEQDEEGKVFRFKLGDKEPLITKFGKKGDYEDIAIGNGSVYVLRSDGVIISFPQTNSREASGAREWGGMLPQGEYEGMYLDNSTNQLYVLCKHCGTGRDTKTSSGSVLQVQNGKITPKSGFTIDVKEIERLSGQNKIAFHPSALVRQRGTNHWFILSSVNKMLVLTDENWKVREVHFLDPAVFSQPEGISFDNAGNLYISNEGGGKGSATILRFTKTGNK